MLMYILAGIAILAMVGFYAHRMFGARVWWILLVFLPIIFTLLIAEYDIARGPLAIFFGSVQGAQAVAVALAVFLLFSAHLLAKELHDRNLNANEQVYGTGFPPSRLNAMIAFGICLAAYFLIGQKRTEILSFSLGFSGSGVAPMFLIYPCLTLLFAYFAHPFLQNCIAHFQRYQDAERRLLVARSILTGRVPPTVARDALRNIRSLEMGGINASEYIADTRGILGNINPNFEDVTDQNLDLPADWAADTQEVNEDHEVIEE